MHTPKNWEENPLLEYIFIDALRIARQGAPKSREDLISIVRDLSDKDVERLLPHISISNKGGVRVNPDQFVQAFSSTDYLQNLINTSTKRFTELLFAGALSDNRDNPTSLDTPHPGSSRSL